MSVEIGKACPNCGKEVNRRIGAIYCSSDCQLEMQKKRYRQEHPTDGRTCCVCGGDMSHVALNGKYCSVKCKDKAARESPAKKAWLDANKARFREASRIRMAQNRLDPVKREKQNEQVRNYQKNNNEKVRAAWKAYRERQKKHDYHVVEYYKFKKRKPIKHEAHVKDFYKWRESATVGQIARH